MPGEKTRRHSSIERELPGEIREQVHRLLIEDATYDEIRDWLASEGHDISRSAIGRYGKRFMETLRSVRQADDQAKALVSEAGGDGLVLVEAVSKLLSAAALKQASGKLAPKDLNFLTMAFAKLQTAVVNMERLKRSFQEDVVKKAASAAEEAARTAKKGGLSDQLVEEIKATITGVARG
jgi:hypothetical protein